MGVVSKLRMVGAGSRFSTTNKELPTGTPKAYNCQQSTPLGLWTTVHSQGRKVPAVQSTSKLRYVKLQKNEDVGEWVGMSDYAPAQPLPATANCPQ